MKCVAEWVIKEMTSYPLEDNVVYLDKYIQHKEINKFDKMCTYVQGEFTIEETNKDGFITLVKKNSCCKVLIKPKFINDFKVGDKLWVKMKKKVFFIYWEIIDFKYYTSRGLSE